MCLGAAAAILIGLRLHAFDLPLETDESNYAYIAGRLLEGDRLYIDVWDHQPFGVFALFAGVIAIFGDSPDVFRWLAVAFSLLSLVLIHAIVRLCAGRGAALAATLIFAIASSDPGTAGEGCNREIYMNTLILAAWFCALRSTARPGWMTFASGCALAVGSSIKTIVAVHWVFLAVWIGIAAWRRDAGESRVRSILTSLALFAAAPAILWIGAFAYFAATARLGEFVDAVFLFNLSYSGQSEAFLSRFVRFFTPEKHPFIFDSAWPLWVGGAAGLAWLIVEVAVRRRLHALAVVLLVIGSYVATCLPARFWPHYYYLLIPALVISLSVALASLTEWVAHLFRDGGRDLEIRIIPPRLNTRVTRLLRRGVVGSAFAIVLLGLAVTEYRSYLSQPPFGITVTRYNSRDFWGRAHGENVRRITEPDDTVFVFGNEAEIYYYSKRRCASRYTMITGVQSGYADSARRRATMMAELEQHVPRLILVVFDEEPFAQWKDFLDKHYGEPIGWDFHDRTGEPIMFVLARRDKPVEPIDWNWDRKEVGGWQLGEKR